MCVSKFQPPFMAFLITTMHFLELDNTHVQHPIYFSLAVLAD